MTTSDDLRLYIQERLRAYDPTIRLEPNSPATVQVVDPIVRRFEPDPLSTDIELFIRTTLLQEFPSLQSGEGTAISDLLVKPISILLEPILREIQSIKRNQSLLDPSVLNKDEADALLGNIFVSRKTGNYSTVSVRIYFQNPVSVNISSTNVAFTSTGLRYLPVSAQSITSEGMLFNQEGELYYFDVNYISEGMGTQYNIGPSEIIGVTNLAAATRATNIRKAQGGVNEETTLEVISRGEQGIGQRSLTTVPGIVSMLFEQFPSLRLLNAIGFGDADMRRDILTGGGLGEVVASGTDGECVDDGDSDGYSSYFDSATGNFGSLLGPPETVIDDYSIQIWWSGEPHDFNLYKVISGTRIQISSSYIENNRLPTAEIDGTNFWSIRKRSLTLSGIPGGIVFPTDILGNTVEINTDEVHVGGCVDFYVAGSDNEDATTTLSLIGPDKGIPHGSVHEIRRREASTNGAAPSDKNRIYLNNTTLDDFNYIVEDQTALNILYTASGNDIGVYRIVSAEYDAINSRIIVYVDRDLVSSDVNALYSLIDEVNFALTNPEEIIYEGSDLRTYLSSDLVDTIGGVIFGDYEITSSHFIRIKNGDDAGEYRILTVLGSQLQLDATLQNTASPLQYEIYNKLGSSINLPLIRIKSIELLDSSLAPTGEFIPYRLPVDVRSRSFQNIGRGSKAGTAVTATEDLLSVSAPDMDILVSDDTSLNYFALGIRPGDRINILTTDNQGYYEILEVGGDPSGSLDDPADYYKLRLKTDLQWPESDMQYILGEPSVGSFRVFFLEPCEFGVNEETTFDVTLDDGSTREFIPDPTVNFEYLPTDTTIPVLAMTDDSPTVEMYSPDGSSSISPLKYEVKSGDMCEITYAPIIGSVDFSGFPSIDLDSKNILLDLGNGSERITFSGTSLSLTDVVNQINNSASSPVAAKYQNKYLMIRSQESAIIKLNTDPNDCTNSIFGTNRQTNNPWLPANAFNTEDTENDSPAKGYWIVDSATNDNVVLEDDVGMAFDPDYDIPSDAGHFARFYKIGTQKITASEMLNNLDENGMYYFDVECVSKGYGDSWNISTDLKASIEGYSSVGWNISTADENLSYSIEELAFIDINTHVLLESSGNDPSNYDSMVGRNILITYERSPLVDSVQSYISDVQVRDLCESALAKSLFPIFIRATISYRNGKVTDDVRTDIVDLIEAVVPEQNLEVSDIVATISNGGSDYISLPIELIGFYHKADRSIDVQRSKNYLTPGRLSTFLPDDDGTTAAGASYIQLTRSLS